MYAGGPQDLNLMMFCRALVQEEPPYAYMMWLNHRADLTETATRYGWTLDEFEAEVERRANWGATNKETA